MSEKPLESEHYNDPQLWGDDMAAVIRAMDLDRPVLVGWSYGGFVVGDYMRAYGQQDISGVDFVRAAVTLNDAALGTLIGPGFLDNVQGATADDLPTNIQAMRNFVRACTANPLPQDNFEVALCWNIIVPPQVRAGPINRKVDSDGSLSAMTVAALATHGREDTVILPAMGEHIIDTCPTARPSWYEKTGHAPHMEDPERFNQELADLRRRV